jgi:hypothetical protein
MDRFSVPVKAFSRRDEERLVEAGRQYYSTAFPNPERVGCPQGSTMQALVRGQLNRETRNEIDSHMMQCSPCFTEYAGLRKARERSVKRRRLVGIAALTLLAVISWVLVRFLRERNQDGQPSTAANANLMYQADFLDLRNKAALRGSEQNGNKAPSVLPRAPLDLSIYLPTGSEPG